MPGEPLYMSVYYGVVKKILSREWAENESLPAERSLCLLYHVSRTTLRRALDLLERDNFIFKKHGSGNFVKPQGYKQSLSRFYSFTNALRTGGMIMKNTILRHEIVRADAELSKTLGCKVGKAFHLLTRLRSDRDYPLMVEDTMLPESRFPDLDLDWLREHSLYEYLNKEYNMRITRSYEVFFPVMPNREERIQLNIPQNLPCMSIERYCYEGDELIEYTTSTVRGDKYKFEAELIIP